MTSRLASIALLAAALAPATAAAHSYSIAYSDVQLADDRTSARYQLRINFADLGEPLGLGGERTPTAADVAANAQRLFEYATARIEIEGDGEVCAPALESVQVVEQTDRFAQVTWRCAWGRGIDRFALEYDLFFELDPNHTGMLTVVYGDERATAPLVADASRFEWELGEAPPAGVLGFLISGVEHILYGPDHILFLLGLLLVASLLGLRSTVAIVTSFTIAHSITLIAAALGWLSLPSRLVESAIAASIIWVAVENVLVDRPRRRWLLSFAFGLIHGIGFATMLSPLLPESAVVVPLLSFNVGVELGQLAIVAVAYPALRLVGRRADTARYRRFVVIPGSVAIGVAGAVWLAQRAL